jgi:hypothetical protein
LPEPPRGALSEPGGGNQILVVPLVTATFDKPSKTVPRGNITLEALIKVVVSALTALTGKTAQIAVVIPTDVTAVTLTGVSTFTGSEFIRVH